MYIYAFSNYTSEVIDTLSDKKSLLTTKFNRTDNFINLVLLGAQKCVGELSLDKQSSIYLSSRDGNLNTTHKVMSAIFLKHQLPMPFNFLNSVNAAILFFVAKCFHIEGKTLYTDRFDSSFPQALVDIHQGQTVLLGTAHEVMADISFYKNRDDDLEMKESSRWLLLSSEIKDVQPLAKIYDVELGSKLKEKKSVSSLFSFLEHGEGVFEFQGNNLFFRVEKVSV